VRRGASRGPQPASKSCLTFNTYVLITCLGRASLRDNILNAGLRVMFRKGYLGAGVRDIVADASAPQGSFSNHVRYLDGFIAASGITSAYVVAQDWGTALAFHLAARRPAFVRGLAFMEFIRPMPTWDDFHQTDSARALFRKFRTPGEGEAMILEGNTFVERVLPGSITRTLTEDEMAVYRAPFQTPQSRRPSGVSQTSCRSRVSLQMGTPRSQWHSQRWPSPTIPGCSSSARRVRSSRRRLPKALRPD